MGGEGDSGDAMREESLRSVVCDDDERIVRRGTYRRMSCVRYGGDHSLFRVSSQKRAEEGRLNRSVNHHEPLFLQLLHTACETTARLKTTFTPNISYISIFGWRRMVHSVRFAYIHSLFN
jgi:hypothetical protein